MAQLSDDCFAFGGKLQSLDAALELIGRHVACVVGTAFVSVWEADGRILAGDLLAPIDLPPFANAAVDGYAVRLADVVAGGVLPVENRVAAGHEAPPLVPGTAQRIFTGAPLPQGADTVFMQEDVTVSAGGVGLPAGLTVGANTRAAGEDVARGALALVAGTKLRPQEVALAAALGWSRLEVRQKLRIALFSTGDELVDPGAMPGPAQRFDSNRVLLASLCRRTGASVTDFGILPDRQDKIADTLAAAARGHDLILTSGGVSTGEEDHLRAAVEQAGRLTWWRVAIKPGRPVAMGQVDGAVLLGLPGNPVAAFVTFARIARPLIASLAGERYRRPLDVLVPAGFSYRKKAGRREYVRVRFEHGVLHKHPNEGAGILTSLTRTDGLAEIKDDVTQVAASDVLNFLPFADLM